MRSEKAIECEGRRRKREGGGQQGGVEEEGAAQRVDPFVPRLLTKPDYGFVFVIDSLSLRRTMRKHV